MNSKCEANFNMLKWCSETDPPPAIFDSGDSKGVFVLLESGEIIIAWYEHNGREWVSPTKDYPLTEVVTGWAESADDAVKHAEQFARDKAELLEVLHEARYLYAHGVGALNRAIDGDYKGHNTDEARRIHAKIEAVIARDAIAKMSEVKP